MGLRRSHGRSISAVLVCLLFFAMEIGFCSAEIVHKEETSFMKWQKAPTGRQLLNGPGSSPPTCRWRCGRCFPCRPVHVAIQPGRSIPLEYYPEAWRCKCGNKLFMP
ncbi:EPIDERMAL PATTERNING FACTOR-like protein 4 [Dendrobium catenatum]|uniref:EPIDERMAL PATTERNING FACTOR-like protein 4 n=1 Tax=Dendrobium catenatum TaxID=906689 RepID=UPI0009F46A8F|nr:EPIDERMAL PATTERNING FACTOR-like protein 4 [Dendrobium catenatum]